MKRKFLCLLLALTMVLGLAATVSAEEEVITSGDWTYKVVDGDAVLTNYLGTATDVVVPAEIDGLKVAVLGDDSPDYTVFRDIQLTSVQLPEGLEHIGVSCFAGQESLTEVVIPDSITTIFYHVFSGCTGLKSVKLPETLTLIESFAFSGCTALETIEFPESLEYIEQYAFKNCTGLKELCVPCNTGFWAFHGCTSLEKVTYSGESVGDLAFEGCTALTEVVIEDGVKTLGEGAFLNTGLTSVFIPTSVTTMEYYCVGFNADVNETGWINSVDRLKDFVIRGYADTEAERYASFFRFTFVPEGQYAPIEGKFGDSAYWSFDPDTCKLSMWGYGSADSYEHGEQPWYPLFAQITSVEISGDLREIPAKSFYRDFSSLTEVTVTADCTLGSSAFAFTENLEKVTLGDDVSIGSHCFEGSALESIVLPANEDCTGQASFKNCKNLKKVVFNSGLEEINTQTFYGCTALKEVELPESTWIISYQAFAYSGLESIEIPDNVAAFNGEAFRGCENLKFVKLPAGLSESYESESEFADCTALETVIMPQGMNPVFGPWFFKNCDSLTDISFHTAPTIGQGMYTNCDGLTSLVIPACVTTIGDNAFAYCDQLSYVTVPEGVTGIGAAAFSNCPKLGAIAFRGDAPAFHEFAFEDTTVTCYYPADNATWTEEVMQSYGGTVTWIPYEVLPFTDVPAGSFYYESVDWAVENGITNGVTATTFNPGGQCQRGQIVTFLWRAAGCPVVEAENPFTDVTETDFYYDAVLWAVEQGITTGTSETTFSPFKTCTRAEVVTFLWRAAGKPASSAANPFADVTETDFFHTAVLWAVENGITNGLTPDSFGPYAICNRAQVVTFLYRAKDVPKVDPPAAYTFELRSNDPAEEIGYVLCEGSSFAAGESVIFYAEPWYGYLVEFTAEPADETLDLYYLGANTYELIMPAHDVVLTANFVPSPGDAHFLTTTCSGGFAFADCDYDEELNDIAKPGEHVLFYIIPDEGFTFSPEGFTATANGQSLKDFWYLGEVVEEDPELGTIDGIFLVELLMPDADVSVTITCTAETGTAAAADVRIPVTLQ